MARRNPGQTRQINPNSKQQRARPQSTWDDGYKPNGGGGGEGREEEYIPKWGGGGEGREEEEGQDEGYFGLWRLGSKEVPFVLPFAAIRHNPGHSRRMMHTVRVRADNRADHGANTQTEARTKAHPTVFSRRSAVLAFLALWLICACYIAAVCSVGRATDFPTDSMSSAADVLAVLMIYMQHMDVDCLPSSPSVHSTLNAGSGQYTTTSSLSVRLVISLLVLMCVCCIYLRKPKADVKARDLRAPKADVKARDLRAPKADGSRRTAYIHSHSQARAAAPRTRGKKPWNGQIFVKWQGKTRTINTTSEDTVGFVLEQLEDLAAERLVFGGEELAQDLEATLLSVGIARNDTLLALGRLRGGGACISKKHVRVENEPAPTEPATPVAEAGTPVAEAPGREVHTVTATGHGTGDASESAMVTVQDRLLEKDTELQRLLLQVEQVTSDLEASRHDHDAMVARQTQTLQDDLLRVTTTASEAQAAANTKLATSEEQHVAVQQEVQRLQQEVQHLRLQQEVQRLLETADAERLRLLASASVSVDNSDVHHVHPAVQPAAPGDKGTVGATAHPSAGLKDAEATQRLLDRVEDDMLSFWIISGGGGKEGDKIIAVWFAQHPKGLTAEDLGARVRETFHIDLDPLQSAALVHRMRMQAAVEIGAKDELSPDVLSLATLCASLKYLFNRSQLQAFFRSHDTNKVLAEHVLASQGFTGGNAIEALMMLKKEEIDAHVSGAVDKIANRVAVQLAEMRQAAAGLLGTVGSGNSKFVGDDNLDKTFEGKFASADVFHKGLNEYIGLPDPKVMQFLHVLCVSRCSPISRCRCVSRCSPLLGVCDGIYPLALPACCFV